MLIHVDDLIKSALRVIGVLGKAEEPTSDELTDGLQALNFMLDSWSARSLMILGTVLEGFPVVKGTASYTIGDGKTFDTTKPSKITDAFVRDSDNYDTALTITEPTTYRAIDDKTVEGLPSTLYFDPGLTQQLIDTGTIYLYPVPDDAYTLYIGQQKPLVTFDTVEDLVSIQNSYYEAIKYQLAIRLYREYHEHNRPIPPDIAQLAHDAMKVVEVMNSKQILATIDIPSVGGGYNIYTDEEV